MLSSHLEKTLRDAYNLAYTNKHEFVTLEHLLYALTEDKEALSVFKACGVNLVILQSQLEEFISKEMDVDALTKDFQDLEMYSLLPQITELEHKENTMVKINLFKFMF